MPIFTPIEITLNPTDLPQPTHNSVDTMAEEKGDGIVEIESNSSHPHQHQLHLPYQNDSDSTDSMISPQPHPLNPTNSSTDRSTDRIRRRLQERKYFDSGDYAISKLSPQAMVPVGRLHPSPERIPHSGSTGSLHGKSPMKEVVLSHENLLDISEEEDTGLVEVSREIANSTEIRPNDKSLFELNPSLSKS